MDICMASDWLDPLNGACWDSVRNTLRPGQNGRHFENIFKRIFLYGNCCILIQISASGPIDTKLTLVYLTVRWRTGDKPLSDPMMTYFADAYGVTWALNELNVWNLNILCDENDWNAPPLWCFMPHVMIRFQMPFSSTQVIRSFQMQR